MGTGKFTGVSGGEATARLIAALRESEARFRELTNLTADWYWEQDTELRFVSTSGEVNNRGGLPAEEHLGRRRWELPRTEILGQTWDEHRAVLSARKPFRNLRLRRTAADGSVHYLSVSGVPVFGNDGVFAGYRGVTADVTQRVLAEYRAREADARLREAIENIREAVVVTDAADRIVVVNKAFRALNPKIPDCSVGLTYEEHLRRRAAIGDYPAGVKPAGEWVAERMERRRQAAVDYEERRHDGRWLLVSDQRLPGGGMITYGLDITSRKQSEEALRENRRLLEQVIDAIPMSIFAKDLDSNYVMANRYMADFFGSTKEALIQRHTSQLPTADATRQQSLRDDRWVFENGRTHVHETWIQRPDGTPVPFHSSKIPLFDEAGRLTGLLGINRDITEERRVQKRLEVSAQLFRAMFADSPAPLAAVDPDTRRFQEVNRAFTELFGYTQEQVAGRTSIEFGGARAGDERPVLYEKLLRDGYVERTTLTSYTAAGERNLSFVSARIIEIEGRRVALLSYSDITELSRAQARVEEANASLEDRVRERTAALAVALKAMESFSYTISHDLRAPLRTINRYCELLKPEVAERLGEESGRRLERIEAAGLHMGRLIDAILELARVGKLEMRRGALDMNELVRRVVLQLNETGPAHPALEIARLPAAVGDETLIGQVWLNLLGNAFKYSARAEAPRVEVGGKVEAARNVYFVRDNGAGFDPAYASKLFGLFQRLHLAKDYPGTGLGLAIVREAVTRHGGEVWAEGSPGKGATFFFSLPRHPAGETG